MAALAGAGMAIAAVALAVWVVVFVTVYQVSFNRDALPDLAPFMRFELPTIGHVTDANGEPLIELAREYRSITEYRDIPPVVRDAILAAEDKRFFSHDGVDLYAVPRVLARVRFFVWVKWLAAGPARDNAAGRPVFPQGGSTITQQLVRGMFLREQTALENSYELRDRRWLPRALSWIVGARNVNMLLRKREEIRLSLWLEQQMRVRFGSKRRAKEEILARYASFIYMGRGQYGMARASHYYFGLPLSSLGPRDADLAATLAGIAKSPRDYAPMSADPAAIRRRRNQILALMDAAGFLSGSDRRRMQARPLPALARRSAPASPASAAVIEQTLYELAAAHPGLGIDDLLHGDIQVETTVLAGVQRIASEAMEHGLERYERRHPRAQGVVQGAIVVLRNRDGTILAEVGGRERYLGRAASYTDFNRARVSARQPGSAMKPIVYLAAFDSGQFSLDTLVPDEPISVAGGNADERKWIANYDGQFKGRIPVRVAFAESRNTVAVWIAGQVGIDQVLRSARYLGVRTPLQRYPTTALGASEVTLLELAGAYRALASGRQATPRLLQRVTGRGGEMRAAPPRQSTLVAQLGLALVQEALRGAVRIPGGTAHALNRRAFSIAIMGKTGTTSDFKDALFVGSTYGLNGITVAVRIGFDDSRSLGRGETGARVALPIFEEVMMQVYRLGVVGPAPMFPPQMEARITRYLAGGPVVTPAGATSSPATALSGTARTP